MDLEKKLVLPETIKDVIYGNTIDLDGLNTLKEAISNKLNLDSIVNKDMSYLCNLREIDLVNKDELAKIIDLYKKSFEQAHKRLIKHLGKKE